MRWKRTSTARKGRTKASTLPEGEAERGVHTDTQELAWIGIY
jgi:hypothetical protein